MRYLELLFERNILNVAEIAPFVQRVAARAQSPQVQQWLRSKLPPWLRRDYRRTQKVTQQDLHGQFAQIPDWAEKGLQQGDLERVLLDDALAEQIDQLIDYLESPDGKRHNLARLPADQAFEKAHQWHRTLAKAAKITKQEGCGDDDVKVLRSYPNGYHWLQLLTPQCLDIEGNKMQHCVGGGTYDAGLQNGSLQIVSLRDPQDEPHVTVEVRNNAIQQVKGKQNEPPVPKYQPAVLDLLNSTFKGLADESYDLSRMGIFAGTRGFGKLLDVAETVQKLQSGHSFADLGGGNPLLNGPRAFLVGQDGSILAKLTITGDTLDNISIEKNVASKLLRSDMEELIQRFDKFGENATHVLYRKFALLVGKKRGTSKAHEYEKAQVLAQQLHRRAVFDGHNVIFALDEHDHPVASLHLSPNKPSRGRTARQRSFTTSYMTTEPGWEETVPLLAQAMARLGVTADASVQNQFMAAGYARQGDDWVPLMSVLDATKPFTVEHGTWYRHDHMLVLIHDRKPVAGLMVEEKAVDHEEKMLKIVDSIGAYLGTAGEHAETIAEFIDSDDGVFLPQGYKDEPFLIHLGIWVDHDGHCYVIPYDEEVTVRYVYQNEYDAITQETQHRFALRHVISNDLGLDGETWALQNDFFPQFFNRRSYEHEREINAGDLEAENYYDDPDGYRADHDLDDDEDLPDITLETVTVERD